MGLFGKIASGIMSKMPLRNYILFESEPELADNTRAVFDEMVRRGFGDKYKFIWWVEDKNNENLPKMANVKYIDRKTKWHRYEFMFYCYFVKCYVACNKIINKRRESQLSIYLTHGSAIKNARNYYTLPDTIDYCLVSSEFFRPIRAKQLDFNPDKMIPLGFPRNDVFGEPDIDIHQFFDVPHERIIVWYPTFRQHKSGTQNHSSISIPLIHDPDVAKRLNDYLIENKTIIVVKPHPAQDISKFVEMDLSNIILIDDKFFETNGLTSYRFLSSSDAMLTDYSNVYFDYMLADKPIGLVWEDIEEYRINPGFSVDIDFYAQCAEKIYTFDEIKQFIDHLSAGEDMFGEKRRQIRDLIHCAADGKNAERVVEFISQKLEEHFG